MFDVEKTIYFLQNSLYKRQFPGCSLGVFYKNNEFYINCGRLTYSPFSPIVSTWTYYDLASLTKPLGTTLCIINLVSQGLLSLDDGLEKFYENIRSDKANITIRHILSHTSGFQAIPEIWKLADKKRDTVEKAILDSPLEFKSGTKTLYSDTGFILLGFIIEKITGLSLDSAIKKMVFDVFNINEMVFNPSFSKKIIAPTQFSYVDRRFMWGVVDDINARFLGGVAGHAGLFGTVRGVMDLLKSILFLYKKKTDFNEYPTDLIRLFSKRALIDTNSSWALGFDTPSGQDSTAGRYFSDNSIGHLGYTGTSFWMDLEREIIIVFLSNRVFPINKELNKNNMKKFRKELHDIVMEGLTGNIKNKI